MEPHTLWRVIKRPASVKCWISPSSRCRYKIYTSTGCPKNSWFLRTPCINFSKAKKHQYNSHAFRLHIKGCPTLKVEPGKKKDNFVVQIYPEEDLVNKVKLCKIYFGQWAGCFLFLSDISRTNKSGGGQILSVSCLSQCLQSSNNTAPVFHTNSDSQTRYMRMKISVIFYFYFWLCTFVVVHTCIYNYGKCN